MKKLMRGLMALCAGALLVVGCASVAWAEEAMTDVGEMGVFVNGVLSTDHPEVVYEGEPAEPSVVIVPPLSHEKLEKLEIPEEARSIVVYQYGITPVAGESATAVEVTSFDSAGMCLCTNMFAKFRENAPAEVFLKVIERDYGSAFMRGSVDDATTYALVDMRSSQIDKTNYEKALHALLLAPALDLTEGREYTVVYSNNDEPGMATATITGIGDYSGDQTVEFRIVNEGAVGVDSLNATDGLATNAGSVNASAILGYVLLGFLVVAVAVIVIVLWRGAKSEGMKEISERD